MYNKLFSKIIRSSVWLQSHTTRIVWLTLLATMDEDGFCEYASVGNLAVTAIVSLEEAKAAVHVLENHDPESSDTDNEGRRIERVPGGWMVLNCKKYREIVRRTDKTETTRIRVARFRAKHLVTSNVTPVTVHTESESESESEKNLFGAAPQKNETGVFDLPLVDGSEYSIPQKIFDEYRNAYPAITVMEEFGKMRAWLVSNPRNRKTKSGITRFMASWLNRAQNGAARIPEQAPTKRLPDPRQTLREQGIL